MTEIVLSTPIVVTLILAWLGSIVAFGKILLAQFEKRVETQFNAAAQTRDQQYSSLSRDLLTERERVTVLITEFQGICKELPLAYVRREDWIRFSTQIDHKLDKLAELVISSGNTNARN